MAFAYFSLLARRKIGNFSPKQLEEYVTGTVFLYGASQMTGIVYLSSQVNKCLAKHHYAGYDMRKECGATIYPALSISLMIALGLLFKLAFAPLSASTITLSELVKFKGLRVKQKAQMLALFYIGFGNLFLFG